MIKRIKINQRDAQRVILTDLLPLEVPLRFSLDGCYRLLKSEETNNIALRVILNAGTLSKEDFSPFLPYQYKIRLGETRYRNLGLFHPHLLCGFIDFYQDYSDVIVSHCQKSNWSVRHPSSVAKTFRPRLVFSGEIPMENRAEENSEAEIRNAIQSNQSTYFAYESYRFYYEFLQSKEVEDLEVRFSKCKRIDVAKCFHNIYTHSISWAAKSKNLAKLEKKAKSTFDAQFDGLMRLSNDGETHGILIGPEVSRIFAELILQQVDVEAMNECATYGLNESDYCVRRYLDDYHIYHNDEKIAQKVRSIISEKLGIYKLFLNEAKEDDSVRPFITKLTLCKDELRDCIIGFCDKMKVTSSRRLRLSMFSEIRKITKKYDSSYSDTSGYALSSIHLWICSVFDEHRAGNLPSQTVEQAVHEGISTSFTVFSLDPKFRNSIWLNRIVIKCARTLRRRSDLDFSIGDRVRSEVQRLLADVWGKGEVDQVEVANVLIALREVPDFGRLPEWFLKDVCNRLTAHAEIPSYFWIVSMIDVLSLHESYIDQLTSFISIVVKRILKINSLKKSAEWLMLTIDLIACPYVSADQKNEIAGKLIGEFKDLSKFQTAAPDLIAALSEEPAFFDWQNENIEELVSKKVLSFTY